MTGKWERKTWYACSECGYVVDICTNFCANCGADMRPETKIINDFRREYTCVWTDEDKIWS